MVTANILQRTFYIKCGHSSGTCFTIDIDKRQYIITARHLVKSIVGQSNVKIWHEERWKNLPVKLVGHSEGDVDISVIAAEFLISPIHSLGTSRDGLYLSQDVYFLGFPYDLTGENTSSINHDYPFPFVKKAIISQFYKDRIMLDGHNNPGFSGGPVVFHPNSNSNELSVAGVVAGYRFEHQPVYQDERQTPLTYKSNTGIIVAYGIEHCLNLIRQNPIGIKLEADRPHVSD